jgi:tRNA (cmo5U34)-methyltransferase
MVATTEPDREGQEEPRWNEEISQTFIDYGSYFVPQRELQIQIMVDIVGHTSQPCSVLELACGEGLLAGALLDQLPGSQVLGLDGSTLMIETARERLARFGDRFTAGLFELESLEWRTRDRSFQAVVSSLAIHHLDGPGKQRLFSDLFAMLSPGGTVVIADVIEPAHAAGMALAADGLDETVRQRCLELDRSTEFIDQLMGLSWNMFRYEDDDDFDKPSRLQDQLQWLTNAGFEDVDVYWMLAGHAIFGGWKPPEQGG